MDKILKERVTLITLFLGGDVMTGRGIDQILPHPSDPAIHEEFLTQAKRVYTLNFGVLVLIFIVKRGAGNE